MCVKAHFMFRYSPFPVLRQRRLGSITINYWAKSLWRFSVNKSVRIKIEIVSLDPSRIKMNSDGTGALKTTPSSYR